MSLLSRAASVFNVGAVLTSQTLKCCRKTLKYTYSGSAFAVGRIVKLDTYESRRRNAIAKLQSASEDLRMKIVSSLDTMNAINSREIQELIFTAQPEDLELVIASLKKLMLQSERMRFSDFILDAVVMRMFTYLKLPEEAYRTFLDEDFKKLFIGYNAVLILLDLLYQNEMHQYILDCVDTLERRQNFNVWSARGIGAFYLTSCLKINSPKTLKAGLQHYEKILKYREAIPELTLLATLIALYSNPEKVDYFIKLLGKNPRYSDFKTNVMLQTLLSKRKLSDAVEYLKINKCVLMKDTYDTVVTMSKQETEYLDSLDKIIENCEVLDVSLEEWVIQDNCIYSGEKDKVSDSFKRRGRKRQDEF